MREAETFVGFIERHEHFVAGDVLYIFVDRSRRFLIAVDLSGAQTIRLDRREFFPPREMDLDSLLTI